MALLGSVFGQQSLVNAKDVINNAINALGGKEYLLSSKTLYTDMSTEMEGRQVHWITKEMLPNKGKFQIVYNDRIVFENWFDGKNGFEMSNGKKVKADENEFKDKKFRKNIFDNLDYLDTTLWKIELIGEEKVNNEECYKIRGTLINGLVQLWYYSKTTFYMLREDNFSNVEKNRFSTFYYSDFQKFGKLTFYSTMRFGDSDNLQTAKILSLLPNEKVTDSDFE